MKPVWKTKSEARQAIWDKLVETKTAIFPLPPYGRIPNFVGSDQAADMIRQLPQFTQARCIFSGPDHALRALRDLVLADGKILAYATPHVKAFKMIRPGQRKINTSIKNLVKYGEALTEKVDIAVIGSVVVDSHGNRLGKGSGYGDRELAFLKKANPNLIMGTLVHTMQITEDLSHLMEPRDIPVDFILTEKEIIYCRKE